MKAWATRSIVTMLAAATVLAPAPVGSTGPIGAGFVVSGNSTLIIVPTEAFRLRPQDRLWVSLALQREAFRHLDPLANQPGGFVVVEAQRFSAEEADLARTIQRLGDLIERAERDKR